MAKRSASVGRPALCAAAVCAAVAFGAANAADEVKGEYVGTPLADSKFSRLKFGMSPEQVNTAIGAPSNFQSHETGKRWIPFYFGSDTRRTEVLYPNEGCLTYTGSNELIKIEVDPTGKCFNS